MAAPLSAAVLVAACSGGGTVNNSSSESTNTGNFDNIKNIAPSAYPAGMATSVPVVVTNNSNETINNLHYAIESSSNTTGGVITIQAASAASCQVIAPNDSCILMADIAATPVSHPGSFSVTATQNSMLHSTTSKVLHNSVTTSIATSIGLVELPTTNSASGADGLTLYYPSSIVGNESGATQLIITVVVTSANAGSFNTINLIDANGNPLNYTVLSGNSGTGMSPLPLGSIIALLVTVPSGSSQLQFTAQTTQNGSNPSTASNSNTVVVTNPAVPTGIMSVNPNYFSLTSTNESQTITLSNSGNGPITNLSFSLTSPLTELSNGCGSTLAAGSSCQYVVKFPKDIPEAGTASLTLSYNDGTATQSSTATVNYTGVDPIAGLTITSNNPNFDFTTRTKTPTQTSLVTLTNSGSGSESGFSFNSVPHFSTNTTNLANPCLPSTVLDAGSSCNINLVYNNTTQTSPTTANVQVDYQYGQGKKSAHSTISVSYQTLQSMAILSLAPNPVTFASILNNGAESNTQQLTLTNTGDETPSGISSIVTGSDAVLFNTDECAAVFAAGGSSCNITFGTANNGVAAGNKTATFNVNYAPYTGAATSSTSTSLSGQVIAAYGANIIQSAAIESGFIGGTGTSATPYQLQQDAAQPTLTYTITNNGTVSATSFYVSGSPSSGWTMSGCGTSVSPVTLGANGESCTLTFTLNTATATARNLSLGALTLNWVDQDTPAGQTQPLSGTVYANVFAPASIAMSPATRTVRQQGQGGSTTFTATLSGGYNESNNTLSITDANSATDGLTITSSPNPCTLNSTTSSCTFTVTVSSSAPVQNNTLTVVNSGALTVTPSSLEVIVKFAASGKMIFTTQNTYYGAMGGLNGADNLCNEVAASGEVTQELSGATWKALLEQNNATTNGEVYINSNFESYGIATGGNFVGSAPIPNNINLAYDENGVQLQDPNLAVWTGAGQNCQDWTNGTSSSQGMTGNLNEIGAGWFTDREQSCDQIAHLYCVQQ